jgi:hypothetical protein
MGPLTTMKIPGHRVQVLGPGPAEDWAGSSWDIGRPGPTEPEAQDRTVLRLEGEYWTFAFAGDVLRIPDAVGLRHLAQLLWHPQREFHVLDLMRRLALSGRTRGGRLPGSETAGVDARATAAYRHRLRDLQEELAEAGARNDLGQTSAIRWELDAIVRELRHGARGRQMRLDAERARTAVTKAIKTTLSRVRAAHGALADHLDASVKRGYVCIYRPDPRRPIRWDW